jgi:hypothetical protein
MAAEEKHTPSLIPAEVERARAEDPDFSRDLARAREKAKSETRPPTPDTREIIRRFEQRGSRVGRPPALGPADPYQRSGAR